MVPLPSASIWKNGRLDRVASRTFGAYLLDHIHEFSLSGVQSEGSHNRAKLLGCNGSCEKAPVSW